MQKNQKLVIIGDSAFAEIAYEYFTHDSEYEVAAFAVEREFIKKESLFGLPVVPFETVETHFPPATHRFYAALVYTQKNRLLFQLVSPRRGSLSYDLAERPDFVIVGGRHTAGNDDRHAETIGIELNQSLSQDHVSDTPEALVFGSRRKNVYHFRKKMR